jgi:hypothetical protein
MKRRNGWALGIVLLVAVALLAVPAIVLAGRGSAAPEGSDTSRTQRATLSAESIRVDRRVSFRRTQCSDKKHLSNDPGV